VFYGFVNYCSFIEAGHCMKTRDLTSRDAWPSKMQRWTRQNLSAESATPLARLAQEWACHKAPPWNARIVPRHISPFLQQSSPRAAASADCNRYSTDSAGL